jgi:fatty acid desaturase
VATPHYYSQHAAAFRADLGRVIDRNVLRALHAKVPARHLLVAARQFALLAGAAWAVVSFGAPWVWIPLAVLLGFTVFNFTVLLHEVVHHAIFEDRHPRLERVFAYLYAIPSGISATQFTRWHLDHHAELGSSDADPKRHHLSPKVNARWYKLLYCTPVLFPLYFRAAHRESVTYPPEVQVRIARERRISIACHLAVLAAFTWWGGWLVALRAYVVPVVFVFPVAFTVNRLGQHYCINPDDPAAWSTLMRGHWFWDAVFLNSNYHLEHHYFPRVPLYRLPALQRALTPFYEHRGLRWHSYGGLIRGWLVENQVPHTNWDVARSRTARSGPVTET